MGLGKDSVPFGKIIWRHYLTYGGALLNYRYMLVLLTRTNFNNNYLDKPEKSGYLGSVFIN